LCGQTIASRGAYVLQNIYCTRCHRKAKKIIKDLTQLGHGLFTPLSEGEVSTGASKVRPGD
jgi:hypothetical protein